jgi:putative Mn2+ efflux pump MntP
MELTEIFLISLGLAMDAFAVSICKGLSMKKMDYKKAVIIALYFGAFQAIMPLIGYFLGDTFDHKVRSIDHWVAFISLSLIGGNMVKEALSKESEKINDMINFKTMIILAIATSIDALAIGITFAFLEVNIVLAAALIGIITFIISFIGVNAGNVFGNKYEKKAILAGGLILILIGVKTLLTHLGIM